MDNITYIEFPRNDIKEGEKPAKLSQVKRDNLRLFYGNELAKIRTSKNISSENNSTMSNNSATLLNEIEVINSLRNANSNGARKLKVVHLVVDKTKKYYLANKKEAIVPELPKTQEVVETPMVSAEIAIPKDVRDELPRPSMENTIPENASRMSRLERTNDINDLSGLTREGIHNNIVNDVINTPSRFAVESSSPYDALINDNHSISDSVSSVKKEETTRGGDPNLYNRLIHGAEENNDITIRLQDARSKLSNANSEIQQARKVNANLEAEVESVRAAIKKIKAEKNEKAQKELDNTLNMLQNTKDEILSETRKYDNLQSELSMLIRQRDELLAEEDNYTRSRAA